MPTSNLLELRHISKHFGSVKALHGVNFNVGYKEIVGLVGDNGAGKSTLLKIISGNFPPDGGEIWFEDRKVAFKTPHEAKDLGIETVYQDLALCENLDIAANYFLGREAKAFLGVLREKQMRREADQMLKKLGIDVPSIRKTVEFLSGGQRQAVAVGRAASWGAKLLLLDEPTSALGLRESRKVLSLIRRLRDERELSVIMISHNLQHVLPVADRIVIMRHGANVGSRNPREVTYEELVVLLSGEEDPL